MFLRTAKTVGRDERKHGLLYKPESFLNGRKVDSVFSNDRQSGVFPKQRDAVRRILLLLICGCKVFFKTQYIQLLILPTVII